MPLEICVMSFVENSNLWKNEWSQVSMTVNKVISTECPLKSVCDFGKKIQVKKKEW